MYAKVVDCLPVSMMFFFEDMTTSTAFSVSDPLSTHSHMKVLPILKLLSCNSFSIQIQDGIIFKPDDGYDYVAETLELVQEAYDMGIPSVTFDEDLNISRRVAYVGTDQAFMGATMARTLRQLRPDGGTYALIDTKQGRNEGFMKELSRYKDTSGKSMWQFVNLTDQETDEICQCGPPDVSGRYGCIRPCIMEKYAEMNVSSMIFMKQSPMRIPNYTDYMDRHRFRNITFIGTDDTDYQLEYLATGYVDGLVGQMAYSIGRKAVDVLYEALQSQTLSTRLDAYGTNMIAHSIIPYELAQPDVDHNLLQSSSTTGLVCFGITAFLALVCIGWTFFYWKSVVVNIAQPAFLVLVAVGVLILASSLVPLSFDDDGGEFKDPTNSVSEQYSVAICMSIPWLAFTGFTLMFAALFAKTWRVNQIFGKPQADTNMLRMEAKDFMRPLVVLLGCNVIILSCWTVKDPLTYTRVELEGTDYWNRVIATTGSCRSDNVEAYLVPLVIINFLALAIACWQCFRARDIDFDSNLAETRYIGFSLGSILQTFLSGIPIIAVVRDKPDASYLITTFMIFALTVVILMFIFVPKMYKQYQFSGMTNEEQMIAIHGSIRASTPGWKGDNVSSTLEASGNGGPAAPGADLRNSPPSAHATH
jgi:gamma-aminobutyric acid type B receptor